MYTLYTYMEETEHRKVPTYLEPLLPLLLHRRPPTKPPRHSLTRRSRSHMLTTTQHTPESWRRRTLPTLRSGSRFARRWQLWLAGTNSQLWHLATSQHLRLAGLGFFALSADVALCFAVCACTLLLCELGVCFFFARALGD
jgi:hypothetical protein